MMVRMGRKKPAMTAVFFWIQWVAVLGRSNVRKTPKTKGLRRRWHNFPHLKPTFHDTTCMAKATKERRGCVRLDGSPSTFPEKMSLEQQKSRFSKKKKRRQKGGTRQLEEQKAPTSVEKPRLVASSPTRNKLMKDTRHPPNQPKSAGAVHSLNIPSQRHATNGITASNSKTQNCLRSVFL